MNIRRVHIVEFLILLIALLLAGACDSTTPTPPATEQPSVEITVEPETDEPETDEPVNPPCAAPAEWFPQSQTPEPGSNGQFDSFCAFHQWSWQSFLWLTHVDPATGQLRFEGFPTAVDVISGNEPSATSKTPLKLTVRTMKSDTMVQPLDAVNQAGQSGVLVDHNGRAVYYSQHVNPEMFADIVGKQWNDPGILNTIPPTTTFASGDVVLKASWKIVIDGEDATSFYVREAVVDRLINQDGAIMVDPDNQLNVQVALVGLHIVGTVDGHPEAIWATFEHRQNAPDFKPNQLMNDPVDTKDWTFYTANTKAIDTNQINSVDLKLDEAAQTLTPITQVARQFPSGMPAGSSEQNDLKNSAAINQLNQSVGEQLASDNLWKNYFEVGAVWGPEVTEEKPFPPNSTLQDRLVGSTALSNSVIETFTQNVASQNNCFACHNTLMFNPDNPDIDPLQGTDINWSHIILQSYLENQPAGN